MNEVEYESIWVKESNVPLINWNKVTHNDPLKLPSLVLQILRFQVARRACKSMLLSVVHI